LVDINDKLKMTYLQNLQCQIILLDIAPL